jgi:Flp pilus assembly protein TadD
MGQADEAAAFGDPSDTGHDDLRRGRDALVSGNLDQALARFGDAAARNPTDPRRQTLLAFTQQLRAGGDPEAQDIALAGYDVALRNDGEGFWPAALAGRAAFERGRFGQAQTYFARAVLYRPTDARALMGLATSAYHAGDVPLAALTAQRAAELATDDDQRRQALRLAALALAADGDRDGAMATRASYVTVAGDRIDPAFDARLEDLAATSALNTPVAAPETQAPTAPDQVSVDVAIVLSQNIRRDVLGLNLLDGLKLQYGAQGTSSETETNGVTTSPYTRTITEAINLPQLTFNLNLFNRFGQHYQVVARPMLTAYRGEMSEFFVGRTTKVAVSGVNFSQLENIDIGTGVKVTPLEITPDRSRLKIEVTRSFLAAEPVGSFNEALNTWRQSVSATVEVAFGETLILSGLSESVMDGTFSKTPVLGDTPVVGSLFNARSTANRRDSVMILVTPSAVRSFTAEPWARPADVRRMLGLWSEVIAPGSDLRAIEPNLERMRLFRRARADDGSVTWPSLARDQGEILRDLILP